MLGSFVVILAHIRTSFAGNLYPRRTEWYCAFAIILIGLVLTYNDGIMGADQRAYGVMLAFGSQNSWSKFLMIFGAARLIVLIVNGAWQKSPHMRSAMAIVSCLPFWTIARSFSDEFGVPMVLGWVFLIMDVLNAMSAASDAKEVDSQVYEDGRKR